MLEKTKLTLDDEINTASAFESAERGGVEMHQYGGESERSSVSKIQEKKKGKRHSKMHCKNKKTHGKNEETKKCFHCGKATHMAYQCSHKETICYFCKKKGHLRNVCFKASNQLNQIVEEEHNTGTLMVEELFHIGDKGRELNDRAKYVVSCK